MNCLSAAVLGALLGLCAPGRAWAQEQVSMRRFSDVVAVRSAPGERERVLYYFDPTAELKQGGHLEQGSGGLSEIYLSGGGRITLRASGHAVIEKLDAGGDSVRFPKLSMIEVRGGSRPLELLLPSGVRCEMLETSLLVERTTGRLRVRNQGGQEANVIGPEPAKPFLLRPGEEVTYPVFEVPEREAQSTMNWGQIAVRFAPGVQVKPEEQLLFVEREAEGEMHAEAPVSVGGVATRPGEGRLVIRNPRHVDVPPAEPVAEPIAPAEAVTPTEPEPAPEPAPEPEPVPETEPEPTEETQR